jgi:hypothetical protein
MLAMRAPYVTLTESAIPPTITLLANTARILAVWKPTGKPEFEDKDVGGVSGWAFLDL